MSLKKYQDVTFDIFCKVVDNYGDIGICWRIAQQLSYEHGFKVRLWVDDLVSFKRLCPAVLLAVEDQWVAGIAVRHWHADWQTLDKTQSDGFPADQIAAYVMEFFGCDIPPAYIAAMATCQPRPVWINFEGLTAEEWVEGCHTLPSSHPSYALTKHFFFPGFTAKTGGLLLEAGLLERRQGFQAEKAKQFLQGIGLSQAQTEAFKVSLFCYPDAPVQALLNAWKNSPVPIICLVPQGVASDAVQAFFSLSASESALHASALVAGAEQTLGALTVKIIPFLPQQEYDKLLWVCDFNFVRGEDSFVRAQWAGKGFIWQIYPQDENLHHKKLNAFLKRYSAATESLKNLTLAWNQAHSENPDWNDIWQNLYQNLPEINELALIWSEQCLKNGDLINNLLKFTDSLGGRSQT